METILEMIGRYGMTAVIIAYFLWKDYKFNGQIISVLGEIKTVLEVLKTVIK